MTKYDDLTKNKLQPMMPASNDPNAAGGLPNLPKPMDARKPKIIPLKGKKPLLFNFGLFCPKVKFPLQKILVRATKQDVLLLANLQYAN